jgi:hypothetical protein
MDFSQVKKHHRKETPNMIRKPLSLITGAALSTLASAALADTEPYFVPLTESVPVTLPNSPEELTAPWTMPAGVTQKNLTSLSEIEADASQSVLRAPGAGTSGSMWDMAAYDATGRFVFNPHETPWGAGLSRYDRLKDENVLLWAGDANGMNNDWSNDYGAFDPATFTPNCTVLVAEEWTGEGRLIETLNPFAAPAAIQKRELQSIANVAHEGLRFGHDEKTLYFVDEWNSGSLYKFVTKKKGDYTRGQTFVLVVTGFAGDPAANYNEGVNVGQPRTGAATWVPITDANGTPLPGITDPFRNGPTTDPRTDPLARGGRGAADDVNGTPYGRPEDMEIGRLHNGREVMYVTATSEQSLYSVEMLPGNTAMVRLMANASTAKNVGFPATTGTLSNPDNLAQDALGNIFIIEDNPNTSNTGGDIWFVRDVDDDGVAESLDHFLSIRVDGSEATGMVFHPRRPTEFVVNVQHPDSTDLSAVPGGFGDALWEFDVKGTGHPLINKLRLAGLTDAIKNLDFTWRCRKAIWEQKHEWVD